MDKWKLAALAAVSMAVASCAGVYDQSALPSAMAARGLAIERCDAQTKGPGFPSATAGLLCYVEADRLFAVGIKLKKMDLFDAFEARSRLIGQQVDAKQITVAAGADQFLAARRDFAQQVDKAASIDAEQRARMAAGFAAMGESMQREADRQAYINAQNRTVNCTSTGFGNTVTTRCN